MELSTVVAYLLMLAVLREGLFRIREDTLGESLFRLLAFPYLVLMDAINAFRGKNKWLILLYLLSPLPFFLSSIEAALWFYAAFAALMVAWALALAAIIDLLAGACFVVVAIALMASPPDSTGEGYLFDSYDSYHF